MRILSRVNVRVTAPVVESLVIGRSVVGTVLVSLAVRSTSKRMTSPPVRQPPELVSLTDVPTAILEKSMTTSARSAGASGIDVRDTGAGRNPPSLATCVIAAPFDSAKV
jgi:hypothetical protein